MFVVALAVSDIFMSTCCIPFSVVREGTFSIGGGGVGVGRGFGGEGP